MLLFSFLMAIIGAAISWKPIHQLATLGKNKYPKWTISGNALLIFILPLIHPLAIIGSALLFLGTIGSKSIVKEEQQKQKQAIQTGTVTPSIFEQKYYNPNTKRAAPNSAQPKGSTKHQSFHSTLTAPTSVVPDRRFSPAPQNRSAKDKPATGTIVAFDYTNEKGEFSSRTIRVSRCGRKYLEGFDLDKNASRTFRLDRVEGSVVDTDTGEVFYL